MTTDGRRLIFRLDKDFANDRHISCSAVHLAHGRLPGMVDHYISFILQP